MKFNFTYLWGLAALLMCCTSCSDSDPAPTPEEDERVALIATLENERTWQSGDEVLINGVKYTVEEGVGSTAATIEVPRAEHYYAAYDIGTGTVTENVLSSEFTSTQNVSADMVRPMVASSVTPALSFKNLLGSLRLNISGNNGIKITKIVLTATSGSNLAGKFSVDLAYEDTPTIEWTSEASSTLTVDLGSQGIELKEAGTPVDVLLPAASYGGFSVTIYDTENGVMLNEKLPAINIPSGETVSTDVTYEPGTEQVVYLKAKVEKAADGSDFIWNLGTSIYVNGEPVLLYSGEGTSEAEFGPCLQADSYYASTSSSSIDGISGTQMRVNIPAKQEYGASLTALNPAVATSTSTDLNFRYVAGVVKLNVSGPHAIRKIELLGKDNRRLAGDGMINMTASDFAFSFNADASKSITLDCGKSGVSTESGHEFSFVLPAGDYSEGFNLVLTDNIGLVFNYELNGVTVNRNEITSLGAIEWPGGQEGMNDLSAYGAANCYMVHAAGTYSFRTRRIDNTPIQNIAKADWLWVSRLGTTESNELISDISYADGVISFTASANRGNALIAAFDEQGNIVWSWHIWMTDLPETFDYENNPVYQSGGKTDGFYVMDRNLGATDIKGTESYGLLYQWGRKDPFIGGKANETVAFENSTKQTVCNPAYSQAKWVASECTKETGSVEYAISQPMHFMYGDQTNNQANWLDPANIESNWSYDADKSLWRPFSKSNYDPCPPGYQIPRKGVFSKVQNRAERVPNEGIKYTTDAGAETFFPFQGYRSAHPSDKGILIDVAGEDAAISTWCSELSVNQRAWIFFVSWPLLDNDTMDDSWGYGNSIRCVKAYYE